MIKGQDIVLLVKLITNKESRQCQFDKLNRSKLIVDCCH